jgi:hypothetical protein
MNITAVKPALWGNGDPRITVVLISDARDSTCEQRAEAARDAAELGGDALVTMNYENTHVWRCLVRPNPFRFTAVRLDRTAYQALTLLRLNVACNTKRERSQR